MEASEVKHADLKKGQLRNLLVATFASIFAYWAWSVISPLAKFYSSPEQMHLDEGGSSLLIAMPVLVGAVGRIPAGALTDKYGGRAVLTLTLVAAASLTSLLLPALREAHGLAVFINSGAGVSPRSGNALYSASKAGLKSLADTLRQEEAGKVRVTSIYPGRVDTPMQERMHAFNAARMRTEGIMATPAYRAADHMAPQSVAAAGRDSFPPPPLVLSRLKKGKHGRRSRRSRKRKSAIRKIMKAAAGNLLRRREQLFLMTMCLLRTRRFLPTQNRL